jgi:hypothetical protein
MKKNKDELDEFETSINGVKKKVVNINRSIDNI